MSAKRLVASLVIVSMAACARGPEKPELLDVQLPDFAGLDRSVENQIRGKYAALARLSEGGGASDTQRGVAYGELGMVLHAAEQLEAAERAYLNAQALVPNDPRWPYYLSHVHRSVGNSEKVVADLGRVLELRPNDVAALIWLGRAHLDRGEFDKAEPLFARAQSSGPKLAAALAGLAQVALERKDFARAATLLEDALAAEPGAHSLRTQLAAAYRGLGRDADAEAQLKQWRNTDVLFPDPMRQDLDLALESGLSYEIRGVRVMTEGNYPQAVDFFRRGVELTEAPTQLGRSLRHKLGTALYLSGNTAEAVKWFEEVVRLAPATGLDEPTGKAHYSLGVIMASAGKDREAIAHLTKAIAFSPTYVEARVALADALRRTGRAEQALEQYAEVVRMNPRAAEARAGYAMALVRLRRYADAKEWLEESTRALPDRLELTHALARLLAAAPDDRVRDGRRAAELMKAVFAASKTTDVGETMAMAMAELGEFGEALAIQRGVLEAARNSGNAVAVRRMTANLRLYERRQPCRTPWADDDPAHHPVPSAE